MAFLSRYPQVNTAIHIKLPLTYQPIIIPGSLLKGKLGQSGHQFPIMDCGYYWGYITGSLSGVPDFFDRSKILSGGDLSHYQVPHCIRVLFLFCLICVYSSQFSILFWIMYLL